MLRLRRPSIGAKAGSGSPLVKMRAYPGTERLGAVVQIGDDNIQVKCDEALDPKITQEAVFRKAAGSDLIDKFVQGRENCTVLTYGASGSGKTHTLLGDKFHDYLELDKNHVDEATRNALIDKDQYKSPRFKRFQSSAANPKKSASWKIAKNSSEVSNFKQAPSLNNETLALLQRLGEDEGRGIAPRFI